MYWVSGKSVSELRRLNFRSFDKEGHAHFAWPLNMAGGGTSSMSFSPAVKTEMGPLASYLVTVCLALC